MMQQGQEQTRQMTGTEGYRTGYNAVHRNRCTDQDADSRQQTDDRADEQDQIQMTGP